MKISGMTEIPPKVEYESTQIGDLPKHEARRLQFSLRTLLVLTLLFAAWCGLLRAVPHVAIFVSGPLLASSLTVCAVMCWSRRRRVPGFLLLPLVLSWCFFYLVSIGPVVAITENVVYIDDEIMKIVYFPVILLHDYTPLAGPIEQYAEAWGWH